MYLKDYINSLLADKFGQARLASVGTHDKYIQDQPWSSLSIAYYASIMLPALIDLLFPKLCWQNVPVPNNQKMY